MRTIAAISTPYDTGAIGIIRMSGSESVKIADKLFNFSEKSFRKATPRMMYLGEIKTDSFSEKCYGVYFKAPKSYTGEDMVEFYCHGGMALLNGVLKLLIDAGASPAENGEFTKRAFLNGKIDLAGAEGVVDMINAESEAAINAAYRLMSGKLSAEIKELTGALLEAISGLEASLDYPEELEEDTRARGGEIIQSALRRLYKLRDTADSGRMIKYGINVAIIGLPNAGKSSLLNALLKEDRAIVSAIPGTTRDTVSESIIIGGNKINFVDTAGIRESADDIEKLGVERTYRAIEGADIIINVVDATTGVNVYKDFNKPTITVYNKCDIAAALEDKLKISAKTGEGMDKLLEALTEMSKVKSKGGEIITNTRHLDAVKRAIEYLERAICEYDAPTDCILIDIKAAYGALGEIDGSTASDRIIDDIFSRFCVGK
ncbi:MAG: tRNA uridine-5-carboxymethylaminomethyl(34) synthesis GTPase MnmE [Christensenellales bacterium]|jgi:tRNA modification GTPase